MREKQELVTTAPKLRMTSWKTTLGTSFTRKSVRYRGHAPTAPAEHHAHCTGKMPVAETHRRLGMNRFVTRKMGEADGRIPSGGAFIVGTFPESGRVTQAHKHESCARSAAVVPAEESRARCYEATRCRATAQRAAQYSGSVAMGLQSSGARLCCSFAGNAAPAHRRRSRARALGFCSSIDGMPPALSFYSRSVTSARRRHQQRKDTEISENCPDPDVGSTLTNPGSDTDAARRASSP